MALGPALGVGLFLLLWLSLWTVGGITAIRELLRSLWAEDRIVAGPDGLTLDARLGPFRSRRTIARGDLRGVRTLRRGTVLVADDAARIVELSRLGTPADREEAAASLRRELRIDSAETAGEPVGLPDGWSEAVTPEGIPALVPDPALRSKQSRVVGSIAFVFATGTPFAANAAIRNPSLLPLAIVLAALSAGLAWGAVWLARGRMEWRLGSGRIVLQRRFGSDVRELFTGTRLELSMTTDSDGDPWFELEALSAEAAAEASAAPAGVAGWPRARGNRRNRRPIVRTMNDDAVPRRLGAWLAHRADLPLVDRTSPEARRAELEALRARLAQSGRLGEIASRLLERVEVGRRE